ncbi:hypothetical protein [Xenorhabdus sp. KK7.4]|uniref:hypothetical protein n=1 Tax=Xenorhabdus sp. KK7.4 TaxID=1851572 RepID=UPI000C04FE41|nr:hypothetical protein [Xenorhabdus sp. KK7.4]PHM52097.1 hypothetical protein Xekk_03322 [Xenorhabdus sp. KK7.4]
MATTNSVIERVSRRLEDQEPGYAYTHWQDVDLLIAVNYSLRVIGRYHPRQFGAMVMYDLPADGLLHTSCTAFLPPYTLTNRAGRRIRYLASTEETPSAWDMVLCNGQGGPLYLVNRADGEYEAHPVNPHEHYKVRGLCIQIPTVTKDENIPLTDDLLPALEEIMMFYAYSYDKTSTVYTEKGHVHWQNALLLLGVTNGSRQ